MSDNLPPLLPCPFCGNEKNIAMANEKHDHSGGYFIACPKCDASTGLRYAMGDDPRPLLVEQWNRRAAIEADRVSRDVPAEPAKTDPRKLQLQGLILASLRLGLAQPSESLMHQLDRLIDFYEGDKFADALRLLRHSVRNQKTASRHIPLVPSESPSPQPQPAQAAKKHCNHEWVHTDEGSPWLHCERCGSSYRNPITAEVTQPVQAQPREPRASFNDPRVQIVYDLICADEAPPNQEEHWDGWVSRRIVDALFPAEQAQKEE